MVVHAKEKEEKIDSDYEYKFKVNMDQIEKIEEKFNKNLEQIDQMTRIGSDVGDILLELLKNSRDRYAKIKGFIPFKEIIDRDIEVIKDIKNHTLLRDKYSVIYNQAVVLVVSNFESFMNDLFRTLIDNHLYLISWTERKKITIETEIFQFSSSASMGDIIVKSLKGDINFQDLQSTFRFLEKYLKLNIELKKEEKDSIIYFQALRHVIIHNMSKVDHDFLRQIRNTEYADKYVNDENVHLSEADYQSAKNVFQIFFSLILAAVLSMEVKYLEEKIKKNKKTN